MAFGDLTTGKKIDYTQSSDYGLNTLRKVFGKMTFNNKGTDNVPVASNPIKEDALANLKQDGLEVLS